MFRVIPVETVRLHDVGEAGLVGEEESEVGGEDAVLDVADHRLVLLGVQVPQQVVLLLIAKSYFANIRARPVAELKPPLQSDGSPSLRLRTFQTVETRCRS